MSGAPNIDDLATGQTLSVDRIVVHPDYADTGTFDAALVHVTADIASPSIALTAVGEDSLEADGAPLTVAGWGTEFFGSPIIPADLKSVDVAAVADDELHHQRLRASSPTPRSAPRRWAETPARATPAARSSAPSPAASPRSAS